MSKYSELPCARCGGVLIDTGEGGGIGFSFYECARCGARAVHTVSELPPIDEDEEVDEAIEWLFADTDIPRA